MDKEVIVEAKKNTFTKSIMSVIVLLYFIGAALGTVLVILSAVLNVRYETPLDTGMFVAYAAYLGGPTSISIIFYAWKSKAENVIKIAKSFETFETSDSLEVLDKLSKMGGN